MSMYDRRHKTDRLFVVNMGLPDNEFGREITINGRSSLEAGANLILSGDVPNGYVVYSLIDPVNRQARVIG